MSLTYLLMGIPFLVSVILLDLVFLRTAVLRMKKTYSFMGSLVLLTAIFDQILTGLPIVTYNPTKILGLRLFHVPIEDFLYTIVVVILVGSVSEYQDRKSKA